MNDTELVTPTKVVKKRATTRAKKPVPPPEEKPGELDMTATEPKNEKEESGKRGERYFEAVGRRKTAVARVRLYTKSGEFHVNDKLYSVYFPTIAQQKIVEDALQKMKLFGRFKVTGKIKGGGIHAQAEALRHGLSRCLVKFNSDFR